MATVDGWRSTRRFYGTVSVVPAADAPGGGYGIALDGRGVRTPAGAPLVVPGEALARALAAEWEAQDGDIRPDTMPLTRLAGTAVDRIGPAREAVVAQARAYAATDLLCYRAESPADLVARQEADWQPLLDWAAETYGARLVVTTGVTPVEQPPSAVDALAAAVAALDDLELTAVAAAVAACGSLVVALALAAGRIDAERAFAVSQLDETHQMERWGEDAEAVARRRHVRADIEAVAKFIALARR